MIIVRNQRGKIKFRKRDNLNHRTEIVYFMLNTRLLYIRLGANRWFDFWFHKPDKYTGRIYFKL